MKLYLLLTATLLCTGWCASAMTAPGKDTAAIIGSIRKEFQLINTQAKDYRQVKIDLSDQGYSTEGGNLVQYFDRDKKLRKMVAVFYGESGENRDEYYIRNDSLLFVFKTIKNYNTTTNLSAHPKVVETFEHRYYFDRGHLLLFLTGKEKAVRELWAQEDQEIQEDFKDLASKK